MTKQNIDIELSNMLQIITDFIGLLEMETKSLRSSDFESADRLQVQKRAMAERYANQVSLLQQLKSEKQTWLGYY